jgi:hypothetical protein
MLGILGKIRRLTRTLFLGFAVVALSPWAARADYGTFISFDVTGATSTAGWKINDGRTVAGSFVDASGATRGLERLSNGTIMAPIIEPNDNGNYTLPFGINNAGTIVGGFLEVMGSNQTYHGFFLNSGTFTQYDVPVSNVSTEVTDVNNNGDFVGAFGSVVMPDQGFIVEK